MTTRLYLPSSGTPPLASLPINTNWELSTGLVRLPCFTTKQNTPLATSTRTWVATLTQQWAWWQFQSDILKYAYDWTTADAVSMVIGKSGEAATGTDTHLAYVVRVVSGDGSIIRGIIGLFHAISSEYPLVASAATRIHNARIDGANTFSSQPGDRIIIEIGVHGVTPTATNVQMRIGDPTVGNDFALTAGLTTDLRPWVELSKTVEFGTPPEEHSGTAIVSGNGSLDGMIQKDGKGSVLVSVTGMLVAIGVAGMLAIASISGGGSQIALGKKSAFISTSISGIGSQVAIGKKAAISDATVSGGGSLIAIGEKFEGEQHSGIAVISGNGTTLSEGIKGVQDSITISNNGSLVTFGTKSALSSTILSVGGLTTSVGMKGISDSGVISNGGLVTGTGIKAGLGVGNVSESGMVTGIGTKQVLGDSVITGEGSIFATGTKSESETHQGIAVISGDGILTSVTNKGGRGTAFTTGNGDVSCIGVAEGEFKYWWYKCERLTIGLLSGYWYKKHKGI